MADYHAVLQRTLSGFDNPKSELRSKLYDRARTTIRRQLENRTPPVEGDELTAELDKLETAIFKIERTYDPDFPEPDLKGDAKEQLAEAKKELEEAKAEEPKDEEPEVEETKAEKAEAEEAEAEEVEAEEAKVEEVKAEETKDEEPKAEEAKAEKPKAEEPKAEEVKAEEVKAEEQTSGESAEPAAPEPPAPTAPPEPAAVQAAPEPPAQPIPSATTPPPAPQAAPAPQAPQTPPAAPAPQAAPTQPAQTVPQAPPSPQVPPVAVETAAPVAAQAAPPPSTFADALAQNPPPRQPEPAPPPQPPQPQPTAAVAPPHQPGFEPLQPPAAAPVAAVQPTVANQDPNDAAVDQWAQEFLSHPPDATHPAAGAVTQVDPASAESGIPLPQELHPEAVHETEWSHHPEYETDEVDPYHPTPHHPQGPAATDVPDLDQAFADSRDEDLVIPPAPGFGSGGKQRGRKRGVFKWIFILLILGGLGAGGYYGWMNKDELIEQAGVGDLLEQVGMDDLLEQLGLNDLFAEDPTRPKPVKTIAITPEGQTQAPASDAIPAPKVESRLTEGGEEESTPSTNPTPAPPIQPVIETPQPEPAGEPAVPGTQNAILYEEGSTAAENTVDAGRAVWSVIEEEPASGVAKEPAIRARIEIPGRDVVLIMKIKRNADKALPASHLIELVFAVPDDFSGGAVDQVSRFVLKQSEQGRGDGLVGVPARIADGIFLIALNNLEQARQQNESLMQSRDWIDIPLQYRTGRRALMTIEKGAAGSKVFEEVFEAWSKLTESGQ